MASEDIYSWSTTAVTNATADAGINWAEGQTRASVNNSARSMMAAHAKNRNLMSGTVGTGGTGNAYTFTSGVGYTVVPTGLRVLLAIDRTNSGAATLNMDGIGALPIVSGAGAAALNAGVLVATTHAEVMHSGGNWYLLSTSVPKITTTGGIISGVLIVSEVQATNIMATTVAATTGTFTGALTVGGGATITGALSATGAITAAGAITSSAGSVVAGHVTLNGAGSNARLNFDAWGFSFETGTGNLYWLNFAGTPLHTFFPTGDFTITGTGFMPGGGVWGDSSDARIKTVLGDYSSGLTAVNALKPVRYRFKGNDQSRDTEREFIGLVAQEVEPHMPEMVTHSKGKIDGAEVSDLRILNTSALIFALVNSVQELTQRLEALEAKTV